MKFISSKENLLNCINNVQKAVSTKTTLPILEGILINATTDSVILTGNDLDIGIESKMEADVIENGSIVINSKIFGDVVRKLPNDDITITCTDTNISIECEKSYFEFKGILADGFPDLPKVDKNNSFKVKAVDFRNLIKKTLIAISLDDNRPILTGSLFEINNNQIDIVSIDGFRLALRNMNIEGDCKTSIVVPGKTLTELVKIVQDSDETISIYFSNNFILFEMDNKRLVSRLLDGEFPNYHNIIPKDYQTVITVNRRELLDSIERASLISSDNKRFPVVFNISDENIVVTIQTDTASVREEVSIQFDGDKLEIGFNIRFFIDALRSIDDDEVNIEFRGNVGPCLIKPIDSDKFIYLVVPVRIKNSY